MTNDIKRQRIKNIIRANPPIISKEVREAGHVWDGDDRFTLAWVEVFSPSSRTAKNAVLRWSADNLEPDDTWRGKCGSENCDCQLFGKYYLIDNHTVVRTTWVLNEKCADPECEDCAVDEPKLDPNNLVYINGCGK